MMTMRPIMIMAGGTGGHVFPALAVADELRKHGVPVVWLGTRKGIEAKLVPAAGYPVEWIKVGGVRGKSFVTRLLAPLHILYACYQSMRVMSRVKPCAVLGMGGFASGPGGLMAWLMRIPLLIHEQNAVPGMTNRLLAKIAGTVMVAFPGAFNKQTRHVGNPVRDSILQLPAPDVRFNSHNEALRVLVIGGSLGAVSLNQVMPEAVSRIPEVARPVIIHQTGERNLEQCQQQYDQLGVKAEVRAFIDSMEEAYAWADIVVCRAGAMTVFELAAAGVGAILVPYPYAVDDHQTSNARYLEAAGAAIIVQQQDLDADALCTTLQQFAADRDRLLSMARRARELAMPKAADDVAQACMLAGGVV